MRILSGTDGGVGEARALSLDSRVGEPCINSRLIPRLRPSRFSVRHSSSSGIFGRSEGFIKKYQGEFNLIANDVGLLNLIANFIFRFELTLNLAV